MSRNRIEQHPDEYREDLNPEYLAGENYGEPRYATRLAIELKELHELFPDLTNDELRQIPIIEPGGRLEQGATYFDLRSPQGGEFKAMGNMRATDRNWLVPKSEVDYELWNRLMDVATTTNRATQPDLEYMGGMR